MSDIVVTWPKRVRTPGEYVERSLESYLTELKKAEREGLVINFRVSHLPKSRPDRCYMVYDGFVRGWTGVVDMGQRSDVRDPVSGALMAPGNYIVREPVWYPLGASEIPMRGFQGWRYFDRSLAREKVDR